MDSKQGSETWTNDVIRPVYEIIGFQIGGVELTILLLLIIITVSSIIDILLSVQISLISLSFIITVIIICLLG